MKNTLLFSFLFACSIASAQIVGPEQDCIGSIPVCQNLMVQAQSYVGVGGIEDLSNASTCLENEENNSVWYTFDIEQSGMLEFIIASMGGPHDTVDYDFALFDLTGKSCSDIWNENLLVRCDYAFSSTMTGLRTGDTATTASSTGPPFLAPLQVTTGEKFALLVDNFSSTLYGFTLDFSNSSATLGYEPAIKKVRTSSCGGNPSLAVLLDISVPCDFIKSDGSNFSISGPSSITIDGVNGVNCDTADRTNFILLGYSGTLIHDSSYVLKYHPDSLQSICTILDDSIVFMPRDSAFAVHANFSYNLYDLSRKQVVFTDSSHGDIIDYDWSFGDGNHSSLVYPVHIYSTGGSYNVCLIVSNLCQKDTLCQTIFIDTTTNIPELSTAYFELFPNPTTGVLTIKTDISYDSPINMEVFDVFGKEVYRAEQPIVSKQFDLNLGNLSNGVYFLRISNEQFNATRRFSILR